MTAGFENSDSENTSFGTFTNTITGPGAITLSSAAVPEPSAISGIVALGLFGGGLMLKRKLKRQG